MALPEEQPAEVDDVQVHKPSHKCFSFRRMTGSRAGACRGSWLSDIPTGGRVLANGRMILLRQLLHGSDSELM